MKKVLAFVRETVIELVGGEAKNSGEDHVSYEFYKRNEKEYAPKDIDNPHD